MNASPPKTAEQKQETRDFANVSDASGFVSEGTNTVNGGAALVLTLTIDVRIYLYIRCLKTVGTEKKTKIPEQN